MLGRLRMTLSECEKAYLELSTQIFKPKRKRWSPKRGKDFLQADGKFDSKSLEDAIRGIKKDSTTGESDDLTPECMLVEYADSKCKV